MTSKSVAVIGAGICGLTATKSFKEEGFEAVCFEKTGQVGGLWRYHEDDVDGVASVMKTTIINTSKEIGAVSDFPPPSDYPNYMHNTLMHKYILSIATKFDCLRHIRYHHETVKIEKADNYEETGRWKVTNLNTQTREFSSEIFDCVVVCIGHHVYPNEPTFPNQTVFQGKVLHTHGLKKVNDFEDQRVVVVGVGNSGMDAAVELSSVAQKVYLSSRRGTWVLPRVGPHGLPFDAAFLRRYINFLQENMPYKLVCFFSEMLANQRFNHALYNLKPKHSVLSQHATISDALPIKLLSGIIVARGIIKQFTKKGVMFDGEECETEVDSVILATGYKVKFPFLNENVVSVENNKVQLYKYIFPPHLPHSTLAILGLVQASGSNIPVFEIQSRWTARIMAGRHKLPSTSEMFTDIKAKKEFNRKRFVDSPRHTLQINYIGYPDELAKEIGAKPNLLKLAFTDPKLFWAILTGPHLPYQYRLQGPHTWDGARNAILTYEDRIIKPLLRPGQPVELKKKLSHNAFRIIQFFILISVLYCFYSILFD